MMAFCKDFNAKSSQYNPDVPLRIKLKAFTDRTFTFIIKPPQTSWFIKKAIGKEKLSGHRAISSGVINIKHVYEIAKIKKEIDPDLKNASLEGICKCIVAQCEGMNVGLYIDQEESEIIVPKVSI